MAFFNVIISEDKKSFYIGEILFKKPKAHDLALETLKNIELIVKNKLNYNSSLKDDYSRKSPDELFNFLKEKSSYIYDGYQAKLLKKLSEPNFILLSINRLCLGIFGKAKEVNAIHISIQSTIENYVQPSQVLPRLNRDATQDVFGHLDIRGLEAVIRLNRDAATQGTKAIVMRAKELGYEGNHNYADAAKYIDGLCNEVAELVYQGVIPEKHVFRGEQNWHKPDFERTLKNLQNLSTENLFTILSNERLYSLNSQKVRKMLSLKKNEEVIKNVSDTIKQKGSAALVLSVKNGDKGISKLLLQYGADPNIPAEKNGSAPLHFAAQAGRADIVKLLLDNGAEVNKLSGSNKITALAFACGYGNKEYYKPNAEVVKLLLERGANLNIRTGDGLTPLDISRQNDLKEISSLLESRTSSCIV